MTALNEFVRLEASGLWIGSPGAQRQDVILSMGKASLTVYDRGERPLAHWSLAAVTRLNPGQRPALYAPDPKALERLELDDDTMIRAIERIRKAVDRDRPHPGRLRFRLTLLVSIGVALLALVWLPGAVVRYAAQIVPDAARMSISDDLLGRLQRVAGRPCSDAEGTRALNALVQRLQPALPAGVLVLRGAIRDSAHLPDGTILLNRTVVEDVENPEAAAGYALAEAERMQGREPFRELLDASGLMATLQLMTRGALPEETLDAYAETLVTTRPEPVPAPELLARFAAAGVSSTTYAYALDISGETTLALVEGDPVVPGSAAPILSDDAWVALQGICGE
jgi:hypothetical protein